MLNMLITYPKWNNLQKLSENEIIYFLKEHNFRVNKNIKNVLNKIKGYSQIIAKEVEIALSFEAVAIAKILLNLKDELANIEKRMDAIMSIHKLGKVFRSLPGSGKILSSKLLALFGDNKDCFYTENSAQCLFGTAPMNYRSGNYSKVMIRRACNKKARATLYQFAFSSLRFCGLSREYYDNQKQKGKSHLVAIRALSNKWVKIIFSMWKNKEKYIEKKYLSKKNKKVA